MSRGQRPMRRASWRCKVCPTWGTGGPTAATAHLKTAHGGAPAGASASVDIGFVPNYVRDPRAWSTWPGRESPTHATEETP